jgi:hypothetical protein
MFQLGVRGSRGGGGARAPRIEAERLSCVVRPVLVGVGVVVGVGVGMAVSVGASAPRSMASRCTRLRVTGALDTAGREALLRYILRPPIAQERVEPTKEGLVRIVLKRAYADGTVPLPHREIRRRPRVGQQAALAHSFSYKTPYVRRPRRCRPHLIQVGISGRPF